jgi:ABC-2 type transport system permease protein
MHYLRLLRLFVASSAQTEMAYSANFAISIVNSLLNLIVGVAGVMVFFGQVQSIGGWDFRSVLVLTGVYLVVGALRGLFLDPSLEALAGMEGEIWSGRFDFTLLRPVNTLFFVSLRVWRILALFDLLLGIGVIVAAAMQPGAPVTPTHLLAFFVALAAGVTALYAVMLGFTALVFWSPGMLFTWVLDGILQMARMPVDLYPGWMRWVLLWIVPVGVITTIPARALTSEIPWTTLLGVWVLAGVLLIIAMILFRVGIRNYKSASS